MLSRVLNSQRANQLIIQIMRIFSKFRQMLAGHKDLHKKVEAMEEKYDEQFRLVFEAIKQLLIDEAKPKKKTGF